MMTNERETATWSEYLDDEWVTFFNRNVRGGALWQARTLKGDDLIASAFTKEHIERIVADHNQARRVPRLVKALERIADHCDPKHPDWVQDHIGIAAIARAALIDAEVTE